jgi:3,4-dihydroxy 2-butanone 4-phosphate synthase / GTP cyclohydrolase II
MGGIVTDVPVGSLSILIDKSALGKRGRGLFFQQADQISAQDVNLMALHGRGVIGAALTANRAYALGLAPLTNNHSRENAPRYMASVESILCSETGISAAERALTLRALGAASTAPGDLVSPGHIMPAIVPEQADKVSGLEVLAFHHAARSHDALAVAWCDILDNDGEVASWDYCAELAATLALPLLVRVGDVAIAAEIVHRSGQAPLINVKSSGLDLGQFA